MRKLLLSFGVSLLLVNLLTIPTAQSESDVGYGLHPALPEPTNNLIPTVHIAPAHPWTGDEKPTAATSLKVNAFATKLDHPRWLCVLPNGDVLVAETNAPTRPDDRKGVKGWAMKKVMKKAGASAESANRITLLRDANNDGVAETKTIFLEGLNSPFGMALINHDFYVANTDAVLRFPYHDADTKITATGIKVVDLPAGSINHHWTKNIIPSLDGTHLYVTVGSNSNVGENGLDQETGRAAIWEVDLASGKQKIFASGLRNPNGLAWQPQSHELWTTVNERDELGDDLVPDYMTAVQRGGFYGWPYSYYGQHIDKRVKEEHTDLVAAALVPDYALGSHTASLGLAFYEGNLIPKYKNGALIGQHGSWNRKPRSGYKVVFVPFENGRPLDTHEDVLTGFVDDKGEARGRPVGVVVDKQGAILVADDVGNCIWRITPQ